MSHQEQQTLNSLFSLMQTQNQQIGEARRRAYRKSLQPDYYQDASYQQQLRDELQGQLKAIARAEYLQQVAFDYTNGDIQLHELENIINEARLQELTLN